MDKTIDAEKYLVVQADSITQLQIDVNTYMQEEGYELQGGVHTNIDESDVMYYQALYKPD